MSRTRTDRIHCPCGAVLEVFVADSLNAGRHPQLRELLLGRRLHFFTCAHCNRAVMVEKELLYFDFDRCQFIGVFPTSERAQARACGEQVVAAFEVALREQAPRAVAEYAKEFLVRVCFGYEELREKVVADEAGLSDLVLEALKCEVLLADPWFREQEVATLRLEGCNGDGLVFHPVWLAPPSLEGEAKLVRVPRAHYDALDQQADRILHRWPGLASGPHVSMLGLAEWPVTPSRAADRPWPLL